MKKLDLYPTNCFHRYYTISYNLEVYNTCSCVCTSSIHTKCICILQPSFDHAPQHAFGIKHSPYLGNLKGDAWVSARTEVMSSPPSVTMTNGNASNATSDSKTVRTVVDKGNVTTTSRTHSDGHKIRTETFTYTKGPTIRTSTTTTTSHQIAA